MVAQGPSQISTPPPAVPATGQVPSLALSARRRKSTGSLSSSSLPPSCPRGDPYGSGNSGPNGKGGGWGGLLGAGVYNHSQRECSLWVPAVSARPDLCNAAHVHTRHTGLHIGELGVKKKLGLHPCSATPRQRGLG